MFGEKEIQIDLGRASHGGDYLEVIHVPTGISRRHPGPLKDVNTTNLIKQFVREIEVELRKHGQE